MSQQPTQPEASVVLSRLSESIVLDGHIVDKAWERISPLPLTVYLPVFRAASVESTTVRVAYDDHALYVAFDCRELHQNGIRMGAKVRDANDASDFVNVVIDTFRDRESGFVFTTTPSGIRLDFSLSDDMASGFGSSNPAWNGIWDVATVRGDGGWSAEFRIPFSTLRFQDRGGVVDFGLSVNRLTAHANERVTFPVIEPTTPWAVFQPSRTHPVVVEGITTRRTVLVTPYVLTGMDGARRPDARRSPWGAEPRFDAGADLKAAITPYLTLDLTVNTDFAESEVDDERINLTRYPLFFPERRQFFIERAGTFELRTGPTDLLFNSRRVGLTAAGEPVRVLGGVRLAGRVGRWEIGAVDVQTAASGPTSGENLGALRLRRRTWNARSAIGAMLTSRVSLDTAEASLAGDVLLNLGGDDFIGAVAVMTAGESAASLGQLPEDLPLDTVSTQHAARGVLPRGALRLFVERRRLLGAWYRLGVATTGSRYGPALAYVERINGKRVDSEVGYGFATPNGHRVRAAVAATVFRRNSPDAFEASDLSGWLGLTMPGGRDWQVSVVAREDSLEAAFDVAADASVPAGRYRATYVRLATVASNGTRLALGASGSVGQYFDGTLASLGVFPEWRASSAFRLTGELQLDRISFPERSQRVWSRIARLRSIVAPSSKLSIATLLQTSSLARVVVGNVRARYNFREGHDLWLVYGHQTNLYRHASAMAVPLTARASFVVKYARSFSMSR